jgi:hypothetical protein
MKKLFLSFLFCLCLLACEKEPRCWCEVDGGGYMYLEEETCKELSKYPELCCQDPVIDTTATDTTNLPLNY